MTMHWVFQTQMVIHPIIDGCAQLHKDMKKQGLKVNDIKSVSAKVHPLVLELTGKRKPKNGLEGKFSVFHGAAIGLIYGKGTPSEYEDHVVQDLKVIEVRDRVNAEANSSFRADEAKISVEMVNGIVLEKHVEHAVGSLEVPMDDTMLKQKFADQCASILGEGVKLASDALWDVTEVKDISETTRALF
jgi:aconitate decarboxylase